MAAQFAIAAMSGISLAMEFGPFPPLLDLLLSPITDPNTLDSFLLILVDVGIISLIFTVLAMWALGYVCTVKLQRVPIQIAMDVQQSALFLGMVAISVYLQNRGGSIHSDIPSDRQKSISLLLLVLCSPDHGMV